MDSTIWAAAIGASVAFLSLIVSKELKISEFRQAWINDLRADIAKLESCLVQAANMLLQQARGHGPDMDIVNTVLLEANLAINHAHLRLNPKNESSNDLLDLFEQIETFFNDDSEGRVIDFDVLALLLKKLRPVAKVVLKEEWDRVRRGERAYQFSLYGAFVIGIASLLSYVSTLFR